MKRDALFVLMPTRGVPSAETNLALANNMDGIFHAAITVCGLAVDEARNMLVTKALETARSTPTPVPVEWFAVFVDDDTFWAPGTISSMLATMKAQPEIDVLAASYCVRLPFTPCAATTRFDDIRFSVKPGRTCKPGDIVNVETIGGQFFMQRLSLFERLPACPFSIPAGARYAEDEAFCRRVLDADCKIAVHTGLPVAHVDVGTGEAFIPGSRPGRIIDNRFVVTPDSRTNDEINAFYAAKLTTMRRRDYGRSVAAALDRRLAHRRAIRAR